MERVAATAEDNWNQAADSGRRSVPEHISTERPALLELGPFRHVTSAQRMRRKACFLFAVALVVRRSAAFQPGSTLSAPALRSTRPPIRRGSFLDCAMRGGGDNLAEKRKAGILKLLKVGIETGDPAAVEVINPDKYIQHNPQTHTGRDGLAALFARISKTNPHVNLVRVFSDGDFVFAHTEYDFSTRRIGFEVFRFEGEQTVEHWDNIQPRQGPNPSGHSMVDGPAEATDLPLTETNRALVQAFVSEVLIGQNLDKLTDFLNTESFTQHSPTLEDGVEAVRSQLQAMSEDGSERAVVYQRLHRVLAEGNFVLAVSEGREAGVHSALYDLFRVEGGKLVEHWDTVEHVAPEEEWKHGNGKF